MENLKDKSFLKVSVGQALKYRCVVGILSWLERILSLNLVRISMFLRRIWIFVHLNLAQNKNGMFRIECKVARKKLQADGLLISIEEIKHGNIYPKAFLRPFLSNFPKYHKIQKSVHDSEFKWKSVNDRSVDHDTT